MEEELNHHTDPSGLLASARVATRPQYLGDAEFVERLVRHFVAGILERFDEVGHGVLTPSDAADADRQACLQMSIVFAGMDQAYTPLPGWNGTGLANHLRKTMSAEIPESDSDTEVIAQAFAVLVHSVYDTLRGLKTDNPAFLQTLEDVARSFALQLVGLKVND